MNRPGILSMLVMIGLLLIIIIHCEKKPTTPQRDNPFDPKNIYYDNIPPKIILKVNTLNGITNETEFVFDASESYENEDKTIQLSAKWDLDGDGDYDEELKRNNLIKHITYDIGGGNKVIKLQVSGAKALTVDTSFTIFVNTRPQVKFMAIKDNNNYRMYHFDASASIDYEDGHNLQYRWDFDGDGTFDTTWLTQDTITYIFNHNGTYQTQLSVRDRNQLTEQKTKKIQVQPPFIAMIFVRGDTFQMGYPWDDGYSDEKPVHKVTVNSFYIGKYEITQAQYQEIMGDNPSNFKGDNHPVEEVSWYDAVQFCNKLSAREKLESCYTINGAEVTCDFTKNGYRLPTEAEWEYAARGGKQSQNYKYSGSDNADDVAWYYNNSGNYTHEIGTKQANELGIYDMSGNVWEWCWDWYAPDYYSKSPQDNPKGPDNGSNRVIRGGSWGLDAKGVRLANRLYNNPVESNYGIGFRILRRP